MQMAIVEFARHVLGYEDANSIELDPATTSGNCTDAGSGERRRSGGTLRLGSYPCVLADSSRALELLERKKFRNVTDIVMR